MSSLKVDVIIAMQKQIAAVTKERDELREAAEKWREQADELRSYFPKSYSHSVIYSPSPIPGSVLHEIDLKLMSAAGASLRSALAALQPGDDA